MNTTTITPQSYSKIINLGFLEVFIDRCPGYSPRPSVEHVGGGELMVDAGHYRLLIAPKMPGRGNFMAAGIGALVGAAGVFWTLQL